MRQTDNPEYERVYRLMAEQSPDVIIRYDLEGVIEYLSAAADAYGIDPEQVVGRNVSMFVEPEELDRHAAFMAALAAGRPTPTGRQNIWRAKVPDGRTVHGRA